MKFATVAEQLKNLLKNKVTPKIAAKQRGCQLLLKLTLFKFWKHLHDTEIKNCKGKLG